MSYDRQDQVEGTVSIEPPELEIYGHNHNRWTKLELDKVIGNLFQFSINNIASFSIRNNGKEWLLDCPGDGVGTYVRRGEQAFLSPGSRFVIGQQLFAFRLAETSDSPIWGFLEWIRPEPRSAVRFPLLKQSITIGTRTDNDVAIKGDTQLSGYHVRLSAVGTESVALEDMASTNGTFLMVDRPVPIRVGEVFRLPNNLLIRATSRISTHVEPDYISTDLTNNKLSTIINDARPRRADFNPLVQHGRLKARDEASPPSADSSAAQTRMRLIAATIQTVPSDAPVLEQVGDLSELNHEFRRQIAARLAPVLNTHIQTIPHTDLDGKKRLCDFVNSELERFGLAVKCPNTGLPSKLKATVGNWPGIGRFHFEIHVDGSRKKSAVRDVLPVLELIDSASVSMQDASWQQKVGPKSHRAGPKRS